MPALINTFLFAMPQQHYLEYSSKVLHDLIATNRQSGQTIVELIGSDANANKVKEQLTTLNPIVFAMCGHGNYTTTTLECTEMFIQVGNAATADALALMAGRIVHTNSCECARDLGPAIKNAGALAYLGSNESFWFFTGDAANTTRAVRSPFLAEWEFDMAMMRGQTVGDAHKSQLAKYEEELNYWISGDGKSNPDASEIARIININKTINTLIGDESATPSSPGVVTGAFIPPEYVLPLALAGIGIAVAYWIYKRRKKR